MSSSSKIQKKKKKKISAPQYYKFKSVKAGLEMQEHELLGSKQLIK